MLDGPRIPARSGSATSLVVLLHGYGADGADLISLGDEWSNVLPDTEFVAPDAPETIPGYPVGRQWFGLFERTPDEFWAGVRRAAPVLDGFLDREISRLGIADAHCAIVGFSQGTMMALHVGLRRKQTLAGILGYSGRLAGPEQLASEIVTRPPVRLIHGADDEVISITAMDEAAAGLLSAGVVVDCHARPGLGHGIDGAGLRLGRDFLAKHLQH